MPNWNSKLNRKLCQKSVIGLLAILILPCLAATAGTDRQIIAAAPTLTWQRDLHTSMTQAKTNNKFVLIDVYTDWCGWCKRLDRDTYTNSDVIAYLNKTFICVKVNGDDPTLGNWVTRKYQVNGYPAIIVLAPSGQLKGKIDGYAPPTAFLQQLNDMLRK